VLIHDIFLLDTLQNIQNSIYFLSIKCIQIQLYKVKDAATLTQHIHNIQ